MSSSFGVLKISNILLALEMLQASCTCKSKNFILSTIQSVGIGIEGT